MKKLLLIIGMAAALTSCTPSSENGFIYSKRPSISYSGQCEYGYSCNGYQRETVAPCDKYELGGNVFNYK